ncbi:unnamed protein product, partial [Prorocentrum cordatum]
MGGLEATISTANADGSICDGRAAAAHGRAVARRTARDCAAAFPSRSLAVPGVVGAAPAASGAAARRGRR